MQDSLEVRNCLFARVSAWLRCGDHHCMDIQDIAAPPAVKDYLWAVKAASPFFTRNLGKRGQPSGPNPAPPATAQRHQPSAVSENLPRRCVRSGA